MGVNPGEPAGPFSVLNGREIFDNGGVRLWRCPVCAWWREWSEERCCGCGLPRDKGASAPKRQAARAATR